MELAVLLVLEVFVAIVSVSAGLDMMPLYRSRFSDMTAEEHARFRRGLLIALAGMLPFLLTMAALTPKF